MTEQNFEKMFVKFGKIDIISLDELEIFGKILRKYRENFRKSFLEYQVNCWSIYEQFMEVFEKMIKFRVLGKPRIFVNVQKIADEFRKKFLEISVKLHKNAASSIQHKKLDQTNV